MIFLKQWQPAIRYYIFSIKTVQVHICHLCCIYKPNKYWHLCRTRSFILLFVGSEYLSPRSFENNKHQNSQTKRTFCPLKVLKAATMTLLLGNTHITYFHFITECSCRMYLQRRISKISQLRVMSKASKIFKEKLLGYVNGLKEM